MRKKFLQESLPAFRHLACALSDADADAADADADAADAAEKSMMEPPWVAERDLFHWPTV